MGKPATGKYVRLQRFVDEYLVDRNGTAAYMRIRPKCKKVTAGKEACLLLSDPYVRKMIKEAEDAQRERTQITSDKVLQELLLIARADISKAFNKDGSMKPIHDIPEDVRRAISGVETLETSLGKGTKCRTSKLKFWDKVAALGLLGKNLKLFSDKLELSGTIKTVRISTNVDVGDGADDK